MLQNAYLLAKIGADTAENERNVADILPKIGTAGSAPTTPPARAGAREAPGGAARWIPSAGGGAPRRGGLGPMRCGVN